MDHWVEGLRGTQQQKKSININVSLCKDNWRKKNMI